ncbi:thiopeptide-type bacteriocin biosynthesis protein [Solwaraspora sp. WMMA2065]|uniref:thiopeptide-type bacteriocin biosynthesis protein n=1 Tax=Solwaraspora sp. WMMA2065 TaxID=3015166 RepID=UPI00259B8A98|nr:thiopeptide-type bacteriocin biosynthesis protein [Solwaraspora sp. WMMA2065]WJK33097.1 thiopeptide-type bacteriocin biosynthesis protein [Solwaraspora sp. WMMA2065]
MPAPHLTTHATDPDPSAHRQGDPDTAALVPESAVLALLTGTPAATAAARVPVPIADLIDAAERYQTAGRAALTTPIDHAWYQANIEFPDPPTAEHTAVTALGPHLRHAETAGILHTWWYIRKTPYWRLRLHTDRRHQHQLRAFVTRLLDGLASHGSITGWSAGVYEPETHAFGGHAAMAVAHRFFHADSTHILTYLHHRHTRRQQQAPTLGPRELSLLLCGTLLRAADQDWHEQGDIWHRVTAMRPLYPDHHDPGRFPQITAKVHHTLTLDPRQAVTHTADRDLTGQVDPWLTAAHDTGAALTRLARTGALRRGLRDVLAHHLVFHWNRLGLTTTAQSVLAHAAATATLDTTNPPGTAPRAGR